MTERKKVESKILILGLDNAGKTSIVLTLQNNTNILSFCTLNPTKGKRMDYFEDSLSRFNIWDFGGQKTYRDDYISKFNDFLLGANKMIFVIDVQDTKRFYEAYEYFLQIFNVLKSEECYIDISIFFHKWDPNYEIDDEKVSEIKQKFINCIPKEFSFNIFKTSIYTVFKKTIHT